MIEYQYSHVHEMGGAYETRRMNERPMTETADERWSMDHAPTSTEEELARHNHNINAI